MFIHINSYFKSDGIGVPTGYGLPSMAAVIDFMPDLTGIALRKGTAASFNGPKHLANIIPVSVVSMI